MIYKLNIAEVI